MPQIAVDPGIVGPSYQAPMLLQDAENSINWYIEVAEVDGAKEPVALLGTPGKALLTGISNSGSTARGYWVLPGETQALAITGATVWLTTITVPATQNAIAQFSTTSVGLLLTNNGPLGIRDNGVISNGKGGYVFIVDGLYWYYYAISGIATTVTFTGSVTIGSPVITLPGTLPAGLIMSPNATFGIGFSAGAYISSINYSAPSITASVNATATNAALSITLNILPFGQITDPGVIPADRLAFIEGWILANQTGTRTFICSGPTPYTQTFPASNFALKDSSTDNLITLYEHNRELWLVGSKTSEVWYNNSGQNANFPFSRVPGVGPQIGCSAKHSIARLGADLMWLAKNEQGENMVIQTSQYSWQRVSNHAIENAISSYPLVSDAIGFAYEEAGHGFYVLTFPTADVTWVYDATSSALLGKPCWHQRASYDPVLGVYHRDKANCYMDFANLRIVGDFQNGQAYSMSRSVYLDGVTPLRAQRRSKHIWKKTERSRVFQSSLQIEFTPGVGLQTGQGLNPQVMVRWSNDGGFTWSNEYWRTIGAAGATKNRMKINRLGRSRDRIYEVNFTDPTPRDIIGATLFGESEEP